MLQFSFDRIRNKTAGVTAVKVFHRLQMWKLLYLKAIFYNVENSDLSPSVIVLVVWYLKYDRYYTANFLSFSLISCPVLLRRVHHICAPYQNLETSKIGLAKSFISQFRHRQTLIYVICAGLSIRMQILHMMLLI